MNIMLIGICGKTNTGKTTFFSSATLVDAEISNRVFTTIEPNKGVTYVRTKCPCKAFGKKCNPRDSECKDGVRLIPIKVVDIAGLVPDAHLGRGLGNQFLSEIMEASALIHVIDASGSSDSNGNAVEPGTHSPQEDIEFFKKEIDYWILGILQKAKISKRMDMKHQDIIDLIYKQLSGLGIKLEDIEEAINETSFSLDSDDKYLEFIEVLRKKSKPILVAANKIDIPGAEETLKSVKTDSPVIPCCAEAELALRRAEKKGLIKYSPGDSDFEIIEHKSMTEGRQEALDEKHKAALEFVRQLLKKHGSTGVQKVIDTAVFDMLEMVVVYPVENEHKLTDKKGNILPDAFLMKKGSTALNLAYRVHEDIGKKFISAVDARTGKSVSADYELKDGDIISIKSGR